MNFVSSPPFVLCFQEGDHSSQRASQDEGLITPRQAAQEGQRQVRCQKSNRRTSYSYR